MSTEVLYYQTSAAGLFRRNDGRFVGNATAMIDALIISCNRRGRQDIFTCRQKEESGSPRKMTDIESRYWFSVDEKIEATCAFAVGFMSSIMLTPGRQEPRRFIGADRHA